MHSTSSTAGSGARCKLLRASGKGPDLRASELIAESRERWGVGGARRPYTCVYQRGGRFASRSSRGRSVPALIPGMFNECPLQ